jgi:glycerol uptake facilitator-like aquaporin
MGAEFFGTFWLVFGGCGSAQPWVFWVAPIAGAAVAGIVYPLLAS